MSERELLEKLLLNEHWSVPERRQLPDGKANTELVVEIISGHLVAKGKFPFSLNLKDAFDGGLILRSEDGQYHVYRKAEVGLSKFDIVAEETHKDPKSAAKAYLRLTYKGQIDGISLG